MKLLVRNLARTTTEHEIRVLFSAHGSVGLCSLVLDQETGLSKGFAFVEMANDDEAKKNGDGKPAWTYGPNIWCTPGRQIPVLNAEDGG